MNEHRRRQLARKEREMKQAGKRKRKRRPLTEEAKAKLRTYLGGSRYGRDRGMVCQGCGLQYDAMRTGLTFASVRRDIIAIGFCRKRGRVKNGRLSGVLGYMHEMKLQMWQSHLATCESLQRISTNKQPRKRKDKAHG